MYKAQTLVILFSGSTGCSVYSADVLASGISSNRKHPDAVTITVTDGNGKALVDAVVNYTIESQTDVENPKLEEALKVLEKMAQ